MDDTFWEWKLPAKDACNKHRHRLLAFRVFYLRTEVTELFFYRFVMTVALLLELLLLRLLLLLFGRRRRRRRRHSWIRHLHLVADLVELFAQRVHVMTQLAGQLIRLLSAPLELVRLQPPIHQRRRRRGRRCKMSPHSTR